jgi:protein disulfide-isomerase A1
LQAGIPLAYIFSATKEERDELAQALKPIAEAHKGKLNFATIDAEAYGQHGGNLNLEVGKWPAFAIQDMEKNQKFPYSSQGDVADFSEKKIGKFVSDYLAGKIEPSIKSEPIPEKQEGPVTVVVAHSYDEIVLDDKKDVLLEFYAPWCGHCKALAPKYDELATHFAPHADKVVIAKVDATANDVPVEIQGFPTIKLFKAGSKDSPVDYSGSRTVKDLAEFIKENGSFGIEVTIPEEEAEKPKEEVETEGMVHQAAAATEAVEEAAGKVAEAVKEAVLDEEEVEGHDEL